MGFGQFWQFRDGLLHPIADHVDVTLAVADSWLVEDGKIRSLARHLDRFIAGCISQNVIQKATDLPLQEFFEQSLALIPNEGRWFPRLEYHFGEQDPLFFRLRVAPEQARELTLWVLDSTDPRTNPLVKGPDLSLGMQLRRKAQLHGADEALLLDARGHIIEGALSSIVWWRDDRMFAPNLETRWLPSVTREEVLDIARQCGYEVVETSSPLANLEGCEFWSLSSLQGIRRVSRLMLDDNQDLELAETSNESESRLNSFQKRLRMLATLPNQDRA